METQEIIKQKHLGRTIETKCNGWKVEIGTIDANKGSSRFINICGYVNPYDENLNVLMGSFRNTLFKYINDCLGQVMSKYLNPSMPSIKVVDWTQSNVSHQCNKFTFWDLELTLFFKEKIDWNNQEVQDDILLVCYSIVDYLEDYDKLYFRNNRK
jgi:hypothetical protein